MKGHITPHDIANEVRMKRTQHTGAFLIIEGGEDALVYRNLVDSKACHIVVAQGRENAVEAIKILENDHFSGVAAVVDSDYFVLEGLPPGSTNIILSDTHDLETMLISSPALEKVVAELGNDGKISRLTVGVRDLLLEAAADLGRLRLLNFRSNLSLDFKDLSFRKFIDAGTLEIDVEELVRIVVARSQPSKARESELVKQVRSLQKKKIDLWHLCSGHDLVEVLGIALSRKIGSANASSIKADVLGKDLRLAYEEPYFTSTKVFESLKVWESKNKPFKILRT